MKTILPKLVADDHDWMSVAARVLPGLKTASEDRRDSESVEIVGGDHASHRALRTIAGTQRGADDLFRNE